MKTIELQAKIDNAVTVVRCREYIAKKWPNQPRVRTLLADAREELQRLTNQQSELTQS